MAALTKRPAIRAFPLPQLLLLLCLNYPLLALAESNHGAVGLPLPLLESLVNEQSPRCVTAITSSSSEALLPPNNMPTVAFSLEPLLLEKAESSMASCPLVIAAATSAQLWILAEAMEERGVAQGVRLLFHSVDVGNFSHHDFFRSNPNVIVIAPERDEGATNTIKRHVIKRPKYHPELSLVTIGVWDGSRLRLSEGVGRNGAIFNPTGLRLHGRMLRASAVAYTPFYIPGEDGADDQVRMRISY